MFVGNIQLIAGTPDILQEVLRAVRAEGYKTDANPDLYVRIYSSFGIDEARDLRDRAVTRATLDGRRIFIAVMPGMTNEAQNALLKTLEEPPGDALFIFILPSPEMLLATLRSRAHIHTIGSGGAQADERTQAGLDAGAFLAAVPAKRLDMLKPLLERDDAEGRDMGAIITFLSSLERMLSKRTADEARAGSEAVYRARKYASDKGALLKPLLEQVALLTPVMKAV